MNLRPILYVTGLLLCLLAVLMGLPLLAALQSREGNAGSFLSCMLFTGFFGGLLMLANREGNFHLSYKQSFALIGMTWAALPVFASLPFLYSGLGLSLTDSVFESVAGITTTSSTVLADLDSVPPGILLWRALLQWAGGIGIVLMTLPLMSFIRIGGMQLFDKDMIENEKTMPHPAQLVGSVAAAYGFLTLMNALAYHMTGLPVFDAAVHAMSTISSGGFSTRDAGLDTWGEDARAVAIVFMVLSALPFVLFIKAANGNPKAIFQDSQIRFFLNVVIYAAAVLALYFIFRHGMAAGKACFEGLFHVISALTGTGYKSGAAGPIAGFAAALLLFLAFGGGCAGSTTSGIRTFRFQVLYSTADAQVRKLLYPNGIFIPRYNQKSLPEGISIAVMAFFFLYALSFSLVMLGLSLTGMEFMDSLSYAAASLANAGSTWGAESQAAALQSLPDSAKWVMIAAMIMGRVEMFPILILLSPQFWRR